jgi:ATP-dependent Lon protease
MFTREKQDLKRVPMMPVRDMVIFPQQMTPFIVGRRQENLPVHAARCLGR